MNLKELNGQNKIMKTLDQFKKILSLDSMFRPYVFLLLLLILLITPIQFIESLPNISICSRILGDYCYSTGITRSLASLLKLNFNQAWNYNSLGFLVLIIMIIFIIHDLKKD